MRLNRELDKSRCFQEEGNWRSRLDFVQRERDNLGNLPAAKFAYRLVRNGLYSFIEIRTVPNRVSVMPRKKDDTWVGRLLAMPIFSMAQGVT